MELYIVQILVIVASIQMKTLKTEVAKGFMTTVIDHEWVGPKQLVKLPFKKKNWICLSYSFFIMWKGNWLIFQYYGSIKNGVHLHLKMVT